jgi:hypothetical protein
MACSRLSQNESSPHSRLRHIITSGLPEPGREHVLFEVFDKVVPRR